MPGASAEGTPGDLVDLTIDQPAVGGRMIARHGGRIILVAGALPGERVRARIDWVRRDVPLASVEEVVVADADRRPAADDATCGGNVFAHIAYPRQLALKAEIVADAFARIGRLTPPGPLTIAPSPEHGYRLRARLHAAGARLGFLRAGSHLPCDATRTGQLAPATGEVVAGLEQVLRNRGDGHGVRGIDLAESIGGDQRAIQVWLDRAHQASEATLGALAEVPGVTGVAAAVRRREPPRVVAGEPIVAESWSAILPSRPSEGGELRRRPASFFQGNRFLLPALVERVLGEIGDGAVVDLYAGLGLFALAVAACGAHDVTAVEEDPVSREDLAGNAQRAGGRVRVVGRSVERYLRGRRPTASGVWIVDPPRTGLSRDARGRVAAVGPPRLVYVSCDVATLARDLGTLTAAGYALRRLDGFDLFPNTAHIELVATLER